MWRLRIFSGSNWRNSSTNSSIWSKFRRSTRSVSYDVFFDGHIKSGSLNVKLVNHSRVTTSSLYKIWGLEHFLPSQGVDKEKEITLDWNRKLSDIDKNFFHLWRYIFCRMNLTCDCTSETKFLPTKTSYYQSLINCNLTWAHFSRFRQNISSVWLVRIPLYPKSLRIHETL